MFYNKYPEARADGMIYSLGNPSRDLNKDSFGCLYIPLKRETEYSSLAQSVEHAAVNRVVVGSSPTRGAKKRKTTQSVVFLFLLSMSHLITVNTVNSLVSYRLSVCEVGSLRGARFRGKMKSAPQNAGAKACTR